MKKSHRVLSAVLAFAVWMSLSGSAYPQDVGTQDTSAHMLVTVEAKHGKDVPDVGQVDVMVREGHDRDQVTSWVPAQGDHAALQLFILLDDGSSFSLGRQIEDLQHFITAQPSSTLVGVAYMQNGTARVEQNPTNDHALAAKSLRLPAGIGGINASPYFSLSDLVKRWPASSARREILMVSDGIDRYNAGGNADDPYLDAAIDDALRAGIAVFSIYNPGAGRVGRSGRRTYWGQTYLSQLSGDTGGKSYSIGFTGSPVSFDPYLDDIALHLNHQYMLTFNAKPQKRSGWQNVKVMTEVSNAVLVSPRKVYVSGATP